MLGRRVWLLGALAAGGCGGVLDRPYQETRRFALAPERPGPRVPPRPGAPVLLLRTLSPAPGQDQRGLRSVAPNGAVTVEFWNEWAAPPAEAAEEALRRWLAASGLFAAVVAPGSRLPAGLVLEGELTALRAEPAAGVARAGLSVLLISEAQADAAGQPRIRGQYVVEGTAPLPGGVRADGSPPPPPESAAAQAAALGDALARLEAGMRATLAAGGTPMARRAR